MGLCQSSSPCYCMFMSQREYTERVATYLTTEQYDKLRESAHSNRV